MSSVKQSTLLDIISMSRDTKKYLRFLTAFGLITGHIDDSVEPTNDAIALRDVMIHTAHLSSYESVKTLTVFSDQIIAAYLY
ncbi:hypothetical protein [Pelosinus fermentans]|uniref:Uncharacterized protein n=1 Tax=Pelosinus fermentans JBW45 TaxID=1192197 RepID=I9NMM1_9FIRM|nr:hypothetical protein [Pelosinus fermentans]AJQ26885.1 hypothetical protein JBW_01535 [Pelosinus fermentans JBW45]